MGDDPDGLVIRSSLREPARFEAIFERHYDTVTSRMARNVAGDVTYLITLHNTLPSEAERERVRELASRGLGYTVMLLPGERLSRAKPQRANHSLCQQYGDGASVRRGRRARA